jgi:hypothetical protein
MLRVEERVELCVKRLDLLLRSAAEELMPLGEFDGVVQHVQPGEGGFERPPHTNAEVIHHAAPRFDIVQSRQ